MILTCSRYSKWASGQEFNKGDDVEVGVDITDKMAEDMLRCDYADIKKVKPKIETKKTEKVEKKVSDMDKDELEIYARENLEGLELDRRKSLKVLLKQVEKAMKEK